MRTLEDGRRYGRTFRQRWAALLIELKNKSCADCDGKFPSVCMDFDHVRGTKKFNIGRGTYRPRAEVLLEVEKCDLVCANCHRIRTAARTR